MTTVNYGFSETFIRLAFDRNRVIRLSEHLARFETLIPFLIDQARQAANEHSTSYRDFKVGCALLAFNPNAYNIGERWKVFKGANLKITPSSPKICAEQIAINSARASGYTYVAGLVVAGLAQPDADSGVSSKTLHPCKVCRDTMSILPEVKNRTMVITIDLEKDLVEANFLRDLIKLHDK